MIVVYCNLVHDRKKLCPDCSRLEEYALKRIANCVYGVDKPACKGCPIHCYSPLMREEIKEVMRQAGQEMFLKHPILSIKHLIRNYKS